MIRPSTRIRTFFDTYDELLILLVFYVIAIAWWYLPLEALFFWLFDKSNDN